MAKNDFFMDGRSFSAKNDVLIIAEIGTSHEGDEQRLESLIAAAKKAGADAVKFQMVIAEEILHPDTGVVELPGGPIQLFERFRALEMPESFYKKAAARCQEAGLFFLCSPFGLTSEAALARLAPPAIKIASPELNHFPLIRQAAGRGVPLILSSGVSLLADIERALTAASATSAAVLHCVTSYPAPEEEYNLRLLKTLSAAFCVPVGVSDHSRDPALIPSLAVSQGACIVEKHLCLSRFDSGLDDPVALEPDQFAQMVQYIRAAQGKDEAEIIREISREYGEKRVTACLGSGKKMLADSEKENYGKTNRSLHYRRALVSGHRLQEKDLAILRTEKVLTSGIAPEFLETVTGARLTRAVSSGAGVQWNDILTKK